MTVQKLSARTGIAVGQEAGATGMANEAKAVLMQFARQEVANGKSP